MKVALDSNILLYFVGLSKSSEDDRKVNFIRPLIDRIVSCAQIVCPFQVFGECYHVMQRAGRSRADCRTIISKWQASFETVESSANAFTFAIDLATDHKLQIWDALIINVAADAGCSLLLSEDLQAGFVWRGVTIVNPFAKELDQRIARLLEAPT